MNTIFIRNDTKSVVARNNELQNVGQLGGEAVWPHLTEMKGQ